MQRTFDFFETSSQNGLLIFWDSLLEAFSSTKKCPKNIMKRHSKTTYCRWRLNARIWNRASFFLLREEGEEIAFAIFVCVSNWTFPLPLRKKRPCCCSRPRFLKMRFVSDARFKWFFFFPGCKMRERRLRRELPPLSSGGRREGKKVKSANHPPPLPPPQQTRADSAQRDNTDNSFFLREAMLPFNFYFYTFRFTFTFRGNAIIALDKLSPLPCEVEGASGKTSSHFFILQFPPASNFHQFPS